MTIEAALLSNELTRIGTYIGWQGSSKPSVIDLAKAGFYFTGKEDIVRCFSCGTEIKARQQNHDPFIVHTTKNPHCAFLMNTDSGNRQGYISLPRERYTVMSDPDFGNHAASDASSLAILSQPIQEESASPAVQANSPCLTSVSGSSLNAFQRNSPPDCQHSSTATTEVCASICQLSAADTSASRRSSTFNFTEAHRTNCRPRIQRTRSNVADVYPGKNLSINAKREHSSPGCNCIKFQESEEARIQTFNKWNGISETRAREFAQAGFIYIGPADRVKCVFCGGILRQWNINDLPFEEHDKHFPHCRFVVESLSAIVLPRPKHSKYRSEPTRLSTFRDWDPIRSPKPAALAKAGFYYTGREDRVRCFFCNGALHEWEPRDDPWTEHARWFPECPYVKQSKGQVFIDGVLKGTNLTNYRAASINNTDQRLGKERIRKVADDGVMALMDSPVVTAVLNFGVPKKMVVKAMRKRLADNGQDFASAEALLEAIFSRGMSQELGSESETTMQDMKLMDATSATKSKHYNFLWLVEENRLLKEQKQCKVCLDEEACVAFIPCGHLVCSTCAPALKLCPICRAKIRRFIRTYMP